MCQIDYDFNVMSHMLYLFALLRFVLRLSLLLLSSGYYEAFASQRLW